MKDDREQVLKRIRAATSKVAAAPLPQTKRSNFDLDHFRKMLLANNCIVADASSTADVPAAVATHLRKTERKLQIAVAEGELTSLAWQAAGIEASAKANDDEQVCVTGVRCAIAETGQLVVDNASNADRLSLLAELHIAVVAAEAVLGSLDDLAKALDPEHASVTCLIAGPSRTADIEQTIHIGAHGPRELLAIIVGDQTGQKAPG